MNGNGGIRDWALGIRLARHNIPEPDAGASGYVLTGEGNDAQAQLAARLKHVGCVLARTRLFEAR
jgi:hypothetical protein